MPSTAPERGTKVIAVGVSGAGSNLRALVTAARRGELGGEIRLVFADRSCPAVDWAGEAGIETAVLSGLASPDRDERAEADRGLAATLRAVDSDLVVLAGYMRIVGPAVLGAFEGRIVNTHPALLPAFPGAHAVRDAIAHGAKVTGCTVHVVDMTLDGGPILAQEAVPIQPGDDAESLHARIKAVEHRLLPRTVAGLLAGAVRQEGGLLSFDAAAADAGVSASRRALLSVSDKTGLAELGRGLLAHGFELVSTGGTAGALRDAGLPVSDVSAVTGFPEMLDGRVKTLHPAIHGGILADRRRAEHREALLAAGIAPFDVVVVNLYPFASAAEREGISLDELVEEIDIGGPALIRAAAKNHASVAIVTSPARYDAILAALDTPEGVDLGLRAALAVEAFRHTAAYDARIAAELPCRFDDAGIGLPKDPGLPRSDDPFPPTLVVSLEKVETLRYGENPHQPAARYRRTDRRVRPGDGPFASGAPALQGKPLSYNNVLDASAAAALARHLRGPACVVVKHTNPCGAAERETLLQAWRDALAGDPEAAFGGVVALTRTVTVDVAHALTELFLEVVVAPGFEPDALEVLASKPNLRLVEDRSLGDGPNAVRPDGTFRVDGLGSIRTAGGAVLVGGPDDLADDAADWALLSTRPPDDRERADLDLAWRLVRGVVSNAIVLVRDGQLIALGSGQVSRVDACRQAVEKAGRLHGPEGARGAVAASDAFFPFADGPEVLLDAGVTAIVQPGGSVRDGEVLAAVDRAGAAMLVTARRHFRH
ncbi:MAG TPA: bifunctional phosphoribosylaminoimidazolecarboxamide formyltransferase/IMP cyclohydrolase [Candidatus Limnocylindrales bacterium]|nr:bifunctional phosphoribosylaminoimidazolecarboxamide formyltransferase/IMP cyclohydrolase [Candidatus Limnocylindrales bacterium]